MAEIVRMPKLSDTMTEGVVAAWHKKIGDPVKSGELLAEIETDKATMEFESFYDGVLLHIGVEKGKAAPVNSVLAIIGKAGEDFAALLASAGESEPIAASTKPDPSPVKTETLTQTVPVTVTQPVVVSQPVSTIQSGNGRIFASPLAKKIAEEKGIDLAQVNGSGENNRITKKDIENYKPQAGGHKSIQPIYAAATGTESFTEEPVSQMRKVIAQRLSESKFSAPHFYLTMEIDMDNAIAARKQINNDQVKISFNDMVIKAVAMALRQNPKVNSSWLGDRIRYNNHIHIGVAVAVPDGLLVPVVRFADSKGLAQIGDEVRVFAQKAKDKKLQPQDWEGNTFTISNLGMFGIEEFTAIVNPPDSCILAIGGIKQTPVVKNGQVVAGNVMKVTLSCDHRVVDGATGSAFLQTFKEYLESPVKMLV
ncbi:MAG: pyruvate dehydrogenase complex dihydrolipoamide acetyltransferase [Crocinitomicaceae bacterium]|nr:pyruvate dehydrogenase complex dihydrolipoamide acetyltransferase [Crocinitomicaceae bacterium]MBK8925276.1 pyruvate dehydrogenase complex dihydrolipoamide acetyltransferase [Crocinitomicaceae bacterium]